jgi:polyphosphate kinase 2 (PPK2 family)
MPDIDLDTLSTPEHGYTVDDRHDDDPVLLDRDGNHIETWRERYPYDHRMPDEEYERLKRRLQIELLKLQKHARRNGDRHVIVFEGRDAAGKGGTIQRFMEHLNPRSARVLLRSRSQPKPNKRNGISSATYPIYPPQARWCCSTGRGTTAPASRK